MSIVAFLEMCKDIDKLLYPTYWAEYEEMCRDLGGES